MKCKYNSCHNYSYEEKHRCKYYSEDRMYQCSTIRIDQLEKQIKKMTARIESRDELIDVLLDIAYSGCGLSAEWDQDKLDHITLLRRAIENADKAAKGE